MSDKRKDDFNLDDIEGLTIDFDGDSDDSLALVIEETDDVPDGESDEYVADFSELDGILGFTAEDIEQINLGDSGDTPEDGSDFNILVDSDSEESDIADVGGAAELLRSEADVSQDLLGYYEFTSNARKKLFALEKSATVRRIMPPITDFSYISVVNNERQRVYGFFCQMIDDLTTDHHFKDYTVEEAYRFLKRELYNDLMWSPNIHEEQFYSTFVSCYENNKRLASIKSAIPSNSVVGLVDMDILEISEMVFRVNSLAFNNATRYFSDRTHLIDPDTVVNINTLGSVTEDFKERHNLAVVRKVDLFVGFMEFFSAEDTLQVLKMSRDESINYRIGELFRRFILAELEDGTFYIAPGVTLDASQYSQDLLSQLVGLLQRAIRAGSFAAELIFMVCLLMSGSEDDEYFQPFVLNIASYLNAFIQNKAYVNPLFYTLLNSDSTDDIGVSSSFELTYTNKGKVCTEQVDGILCDVIGDNNNIYQIPLVHLNSDKSSVLCPPIEVVNSLRGIAVAGRISVNGFVRYRFVPSFNWLSMLNITDTSYEDTSIGNDNLVNHIDNPLIATLMKYDNKFSESDPEPEVISIRGGDVLNLLVVRRQGNEATPISRMVLNGVPNPITSGMMAVDDEDGSVIVRYKDNNTSLEDVIVLGSNSYERIVHTAPVSPVDNLSQVNKIIDFAKIQPVTPEFYCLESVVKRVCALTSFDYDEKLEEARMIVIQNLYHVIRPSFLNQVLGCKMLEAFYSYIEEYEKKDSDFVISIFNFQTVKDIMDFTIGIPNDLTDINTPPENFKEILARAIQSLSKETSEIFDILNSLKMHTLALQALSHSGIADKGDADLYLALHYIPRLHSRLTILENEIVLVMVLNEAGDDIRAIIQKNSALFSAFNKSYTRDSLDSIEGTMLTSLRAKNHTCFRVTRDILFTATKENYIILKYFILDRDLYGVMSILEDCCNAEPDNSSMVEFFDSLKEELGISKEISISSVEENVFNAEHNRVETDAIFNKYYDKFIELVYLGLITDVSKTGDLQIFKAYDMLSSFGYRLFNFDSSKETNFNDTSEFERTFYDYVGSFILTYSPITGEAEDDVISGIDRFGAYVKNRSNFYLKSVLSELDDFSLVDLHYIEEADGMDGLEKEGDYIPEGNVTSKVSVEDTTSLW